MYKPANSFASAEIIAMNIVRVIILGALIDEQHSSTVNEVETGLSDQSDTVHGREDYRQVLVAADGNQS